VIDPQNARDIDLLSRSLKAASGDVVVVATVPTIEPAADVDEYAVKMFENRGRGVGTKGNDNGLLIVLALKEKRVRIEVGYGLEPWITDGFAGETIRQVMAPEFREGRYGEGLRDGTARIVARIARGRNVTLQGVRIPQSQEDRGAPFSLAVPLLIFIVILIISRIGGGPGAGMMLWGASRGWSGWSSGVGPFGGGWGGGSGRGGGGFGGGFGGFGGGGSGGGGASGGW
jgi:uncharacterized protein